MLTVVWIGLGALLTGPFAEGTIVRTDERVARWMVAQRTPSWNHVTVWGSLLAETTTKVVATTLLALAFLALWRRWFEPVFLVASLVIEAAACRSAEARQCGRWGASVSPLPRSTSAVSRRPSPR